MAKRKIIKIDEDRCDGCRLCVPNCPEGAIQIIDGKARLVSDLFCDGLGACLGHCPQGAITIEEREAEPYDELKVMENIVKAGPNTIKAHLSHLKEHGETKYLKEAVEYLKERKVPFPAETKAEGHQHFSGCPGSRMMDFTAQQKTGGSEEGERPSELRQWPVQLHLISPHVPYYQGKDVVIAADCTAYAFSDFHKNYLKGKSLAIACPKLDEGLDVYAEKIKAMIDDSKINTLTVVTMEVPCCAGLLHIAKQAAGQAKRRIPVKSVVVGIKGDILSEEWA